jgi:GT2 family glycosyltransferase
MSERSRTPLVSVVVVNFDGRHHLERCLPSLVATAGVEFEVIVADNGSTDGSVDWLAREWPAVRVLALGENLGFGRANGRGVRSARGEFVAFLNNDTVVEPDWLSALLQPLRLDPEVAASCATLRLLEFPELVNACGGAMTSAGYGYDIDFMTPVERGPVGRESTAWHDVLFPTAAAALIRKEEFLAVGGFDPAMFMYHEDVDLGLRLRLMGRRVVVCERAVVYHTFGGTSARCSNAIGRSGSSARRGASRGSGSCTARSDRRSGSAGGTSSTCPRLWRSDGGFRRAGSAAKATCIGRGSSPAPAGRPPRRNRRLQRTPKPSPIGSSPRRSCPPGIRRLVVWAPVGTLPRH